MKRLSILLGVGAMGFAAPASADDRFGPNDLVVQDGMVRLVAEASPIAAPEIHYYGHNGHWLQGLDVANHGGGGYDFVAAARATGEGSSYRVEDIIYLSPSSLGTRVGIGRTPPTGSYRLETGSLGPLGDALGIYMAENATGDAIGIHDSSGALRWRLDSSYRIQSPQMSSIESRLDEVGPLQARVNSLEERLAERVSVIDSRLQAAESRIVKLREKLKRWRGR